MRQRSNAALVEEYRPLVRRIAWDLTQRMPASVEQADLEQAGMIGLIKSAPRFTGESGASFGTFVSHRIRGAMLDSLRKGNWAPRSVARASRDIAKAIRAIEAAEQRPARESEIAERLGLSLEAYRKILLDTKCQHVFSSDSEVPEQIHGVTEGLSKSPLSPEIALETEGFFGALHQAIAKLPERERKIIERIYFDGATLREAGTELGVTESRACQLRAQAIARLKAGLVRD